MWQASAAEAAGARASPWHDLALREASGEPGRSLSQLGFSTSASSLVGKRVAEDSDERVAEVGEELGEGRARADRVDDRDHRLGGVRHARARRREQRCGLRRRSRKMIRRAVQSQREFQASCWACGSMQGFGSGGISTFEKPALFNSSKIGGHVPPRVRRSRGACRERAPLVGGRARGGAGAGGADDRGGEGLSHARHRLVRWRADQV
eukprot:scaffold57350_cov69-Phaeocystis_antarctica.AAC.1